LIWKLVSNADAVAYLNTAWISVKLRSLSCCWKQVLEGFLAIPLFKIVNIYLD